MISIAWFDTHAVVRAGLASLCARRDDVAAVGSAVNERELMAIIDNAHPDVIVLDLDQGGSRGLRQLLFLRQREPGLHIVDYTTERPDQFVVAALVAGADAVVSKSDTPDALFDAIAGVLDGQRTPEDIAPGLIADAAAKLDPADHAILTMRLAGEDLNTIARTLRLPPLVAANRTARVLAQLSTTSALPRAVTSRRPGFRATRPVPRGFGMPQRASGPQTV